MVNKSHFIARIDTTDHPNRIKVRISESETILNCHLPKNCSYLHSQFSLADKLFYVRGRLCREDLHQPQTFIIEQIIPI